MSSKFVVYIQTHEFNLHYGNIDERIKVINTTKF